MCSQTHTPLCHLPAVLLCRTSGLMMSFLWCAPMQKGKPRGFMWGGFGGGGAMFPLRRLRGQLVNNGSTGEVCLLGRSHPFICATHYHSLCPPAVPNKAFCVYDCSCVFYQTFSYLALTLFCQNWSAKIGHVTQVEQSWSRLFCVFVWRRAWGMDLSGRPLSLSLAVVLSQAYNSHSQHLFWIFSSPAVRAPSFYIIIIAKECTSWKTLSRYGKVHGMWLPLGGCQQGHIFRSCQRAVKSAETVDVLWRNRRVKINCLEIEECYFEKKVR